MSSAPPAATPEPPTGVLFWFPTVGKGPGQWPLTQAKVDEWSEAYPNLDVLAECRRALVWVNENTRHRKTVGGMGKFLVGWFNRTTDRGAQRPNGHGPPPKPTPGQLPDYSGDEWWHECQRLHGGKCNGQWGHLTQMRIDAARSFAQGES